MFSRAINLLRSLYIWTGAAVLTAIWIPLLAIVRLFDRDPNHIRTARWFRRLGRAFTKVYPWRVNISGLENINPNQVYVIVSNHQSFADIPLISCVPLDAKWLGKIELFRAPIMGWMMRMAGDIPVDRADRRKAAQAWLRCAKTLRNGCSVLMFPEGTRSRDGELLPFIDGPFQLAIREHVPLLPLLVVGSGGVLPPGSWIYGDGRNVQLRVLPAVPVDGYDAKQSSELRDKVRQRMADELGVIQSVI
jgi:1-acyl-sn-glycerol-3-phosphate acyltransferase